MVQSINQPMHRSTNQDKWVRGPFGPVQANLDHLLLMKPSQRWKLAKNLFDRQNEILRKHGNV